MKNYSVEELPRDTQPKQEPVAWMYDFLNTYNREEVIRDWVTQDLADIEREKGFNVRPLYATSQPCPTCQSLARTVMMDQTGYDPRPWVDLTDEDVAKLASTHLFQNVWPHSTFAAIHAIEAKLKEKNGAA